MTSAKSLAEDRLIRELKSAQRALLSDETSPSLLASLKTQLSDFSDNVFIIECIPEQAEDMYTILINGNVIIEVEISREKAVQDPVSFDVLSLQTYMKVNPNLSKTIRRKLNLAVLLSKQ